jgi:hypothetical protein
MKLINPLGKSIVGKIRLAQFTMEKKVEGTKEGNK